MTMSEHPASGRTLDPEGAAPRRVTAQPSAPAQHPSGAGDLVRAFVCLPVDLDGGGVDQTGIDDLSRAFGLNPRYGNLGRIYFAVPHDTLCHLHAELKPLRLGRHLSRF